MTDKQKLNEAIDICREMQLSINALDAVHTAMEEGSHSADGFVDALYFVFCGLYDEQKKLHELLNG